MTNNRPTVYFTSVKNWFDLIRSRGNKFDSLVGMFVFVYKLYIDLETIRRCCMVEVQAYRQVPIYTREWHKRWSYLEISIDANGRVKLFTDRGSYPLNQRLRLLPAMITSRPTELPGAASFQEQLWRSSSSSSSSSSMGSSRMGAAAAAAATQRQHLYQHRLQFYVISNGRSWRLSWSVGGCSGLYRLTLTTHAHWIQEDDRLAPGSTSV